MYYVCRPKRISLYINTGRKSMAQIQRELGCDVLVNGGLYDMQRYTPNCWLRSDGKTLHTENWSDFGFGWDVADLTLDTSDNITQYRNYISCVCLLKGKEKLRLSYPAELGGKRGRSAIGRRSNGDVVVCCTQDGSAFAMTPEQLQTDMTELGCVDALMLDGGGSSQCITPVGYVYSQRTVYDYIAIWLTDQKPKDECPYSEPTRLIRWGSVGEGAKWVQWQLRRHGILIDVDGLFFGQSVSALRSFQAAHGLVNDGVCGEKSREELKK